ncbi:hypothetical protein HDU85_006389 [Gaertneriomyces sp. JEL0708]|nr:hypothetical protein HDU85_006389 [Gaertneriomyces sp. JEL0708]
MLPNELLLRILSYLTASELSQVLASNQALRAAAITSLADKLFVDNGHVPSGFIGRSELDGAKFELLLSIGNGKYQQIFLEITAEPADIVPGWCAPKGWRLRPRPGPCNVLLLAADGEEKSCIGGTPVSPIMGPLKSHQSLDLAVGKQMTHVCKETAEVKTTHMLEQLQLPFVSSGSHTLCNSRKTLEVELRIEPTGQGLELEVRQVWMTSGMLLGKRFKKAGLEEPCPSVISPQGSMPTSLWRPASSETCVWWSGG